MLVPDFIADTSGRGTEHIPKLALAQDVPTTGSAQAASMGFVRASSSGWDRNHDEITSSSSTS
jgi:hypothetical protein